LMNRLTDHRTRLSLRHSDLVNAEYPSLELLYQRCLGDLSCTDYFEDDETYRESFCVLLRRREVLEAFDSSAMWSRRGAAKIPEP